MKEADDLATMIGRLSRQEGTHVETWVSIVLAFSLTVVGGGIFWRMQLALREISSEMGETTFSRLQALLSGALLPFLALSTGSFLILVVTVLAMRWTRLRLERERRQVQVADLVTRLISQYQDEYLSRIGSWLHDGIGHGLVLQKMEVEYLKKTGELSEEKGVRMIEQLKGLIEQTRSMAGMIYPHTLFQFGLASSLSNLIDNFVQMSHIPVEREIDVREGCCSDEISLLVFRIVQEALTNVVKHAKATHVRVEILSDGQGLRGSVSNDGVAMQEGGSGRRGIGLTVITERAKRLGGMVEVDSTGGRPYRLAFSFSSNGNGGSGPKSSTFICSDSLN